MLITMTATRYASPTTFYLNGSTYDVPDALAYQFVGADVARFVTNQSRVVQQRTLPDSVTLPTVFANVRDWGATADGVRDSSVAINSALEYAAGTGATVFFPYGTYRCDNTIVAHRCKMIGDNATLNYVGLSDTTDCLELQGSTAETPLCVENIHVAANGVGRDAVRVSAGKTGSTQSDFMRLRGLRINQAKRDGIHVEAGVTNCWVEDARYQDIRILAAGRHGVAMIAANLGNAFINQCTFDNVEIRQAGKLQAGVDVYCDSQGASGAAKISELTWLGCEFDAALGSFHSQASISLNQTGSSSGYDGWTFIGCTFEDVGGAIITGFPYAVQINNSASVGGMSVLGGLIVNYGDMVNPALVSRLFVSQGAGNRNTQQLDMQTLANSYANDAAAAAAGFSIGEIYRNGSALQVRVT